MSEDATLRIMKDILENKFSLVDLSKLNERQERCNMNAIVMGLLAYDDRGSHLVNSERQKCKMILTTSLEKMRADFIKQCPEVAGALQDRLKRRCKVAVKTAADHVRQIFEPLNWYRKSLDSSLPWITLRSLRDRKDADADLFLPLLLIEMLADLRFYCNATKANANLQRMEEYMGYNLLIPLALQELEQVNDLLAEKLDLEQQGKGMAAKAKGARKRTKRRKSTKSKSVMKRQKKDISKVTRGVPLASKSQDSCASQAIWYVHDQQTAMDEHLLSMLRGPMYEEEEVPLISTMMFSQEHALFSMRYDVLDPYSTQNPYPIPPSASPPPPLVDSGIVHGARIDAYGSELDPDLISITEHIMNNDHHLDT